MDQAESIHVNVTAWTVDVTIHSADDSQLVIYEYIHKRVILPLKANR